MISTIDLFIRYIMSNSNIISPCFGLAGTILIFFFGLPPRVDPEGHINIICEQEDENEKKKGRIYKKIGNTGLVLLIFSFLIALIGQIYEK